MKLGPVLNFVPWQRDNHAYGSVFARFWAKIVTLLLVIPTAVAFIYKFAAIPYFATDTWKMVFGSPHEQPDAHAAPEPATLVRAAKLFPDRVSASWLQRPANFGRCVLSERCGDQAEPYHQGPKLAVVTHIRPLVEVVAPSIQMAYNLDPGGRSRKHTAERKRRGHPQLG
jgi:hypothetical protein